jgi:hypothetical protein
MFINTSVQILTQYCVGRLGAMLNKIQVLDSKLNVPRAIIVANAAGATMLSNKYFNKLLLDTDEFKKYVQYFPLYTGTHYVISASDKPFANEVSHEFDNGKKRYAFKIDAQYRKQSNLMLLCDHAFDKNTGQSSIFLTNKDGKLILDLEGLDKESEIFVNFSGAIREMTIASRAAHSYTEQRDKHILQFYAYGPAALGLLVRGMKDLDDGGKHNVCGYAKPSQDYNILAIPTVPKPVVELKDENLSEKPGAATIESLDQIIANARLALGQLKLTKGVAQKEISALERLIENAEKELKK